MIWPNAWPCSWPRGTGGLQDAWVVANLPLLARRDLALLRKLCGVDDEDLLDMAAEIKTLDPRPGTAFVWGVADPVVLDVVRASNDGSWAVELEQRHASARARGQRRLYLVCRYSGQW